MATYAIGDIQGCYQELLDLLDKINFDHNNDQLWFTGDIVNRGPDSLKCLRYVKKLDAITVLGNHDLHLLAIAVGKSAPRKKDTLDDILNAPDKEELLDWLLHQPLLYQDKDLGFILVHAGLPPQWDIPTARQCAHEVENVLRGKKYIKFFAHMYGDQPAYWSNDLQEWDRLRFITNCLTRIRYCDAEGGLTLKDKGPPGSQGSPYMPWFQVSNRKSRNKKIIIGHWATIRLGNIKEFVPVNVYPLDTGCVWGGELTALRLEDRKYFQVPSRQG